MHLGSPFREALGSNTDQTAYRIALAQDRRYLLYRLSDSENWWQLDMATGSDRPLLAGMIGYERRTIDADGRFVAAVSASASGSAPFISVIDLVTSQVRRFPLPAPKEGTTQELDWTAGSTAIVFSIAYGGAQRYWELDVPTGRFTSIEGRKEHSRPLRLFKVGAELPRECLGCLRNAQTAPLALSDGTVIAKINQEIVVDRLGRPRRIVDRTPPNPAIRYPDGSVVVTATGCTSEVFIEGVVDERYLIYRKGFEYWAYGIEENRKALLSDRPIIDLTW